VSRGRSVRFNKPSPNGCAFVADGQGLDETAHLSSILVLGLGLREPCTVVVVPDSAEAEGAVEKALTHWENSLPCSKDRGCKICDEAREAIAAARAEWAQMRAELERLRAEREGEKVVEFGPQGEYGPVRLWDRNNVIAELEPGRYAIREIKPEEKAVRPRMVRGNFRWGDSAAGYSCDLCGWVSATNHADCQACYAKWELPARDLPSEEG